MTQKDKISDIIKNQKRELNNWMETIKSKLKLQLNNKINKVDIFLIDKDWLDKYTKTFFDYKDNLEIDEAFLKFENIDNSKLSKEINENSKFYILNENCWLTLIRDRNKELEIKFEGYFLNNILLLIREAHFYFLYMDSNIIKKAYLKININNNENNNVKEQIINLFKDNNYIIDNIKKYISTKDVKIFNNTNLIIKEDNSIFTYNNKVKGKNIDLKYNKALSFNGINGKNLYRKPNQISSNNKNNYKLKAIKVIDGNQKESEKENKKDIMNKINKIPKNYCHKKLYYKNDFNNNININNKNNLENNNIKSKRIKIEEKKKIDFNYELNKELFDPETKIKRNISVQPKLILKSKLRKNFDMFPNFFPNKTIEKKSTPGLIGLSKIEDSIPYMNAILQCLSNIKNLRIELLKNNIYEDLNTNKTTNKKISFALADVLKNLWKNLDQRIYKPNYFKNKISEINPNFNNKNYGEPKVLIRFLLDNIHNELNMPKSNINLLNQKIYFNMFKNNYEDKNNSIISREFNGYLNTNEICLNCNYIANTYFENFEILNFSMDDIRKIKNNNCNSINYNDCFDYYDREKYMTSYCCQFCGKNIIKKSKFYYLPQTLIINFKYGGRPEIEQNNFSFEYNEFLDLKKYLNLNLNDSPFYYELIGVICFLKSNENEKHFVAFCKNSENCKWYKYNDDSVTLISFGEISINTIPYVMFFSYIKT